MPKCNQQFSTLTEWAEYKDDVQGLLGVQGMCVSCVIS